MVMGGENEMVLCNCPNHLLVGITALNGETWGTFPPNLLISFYSKWAIL